MNRKTLLGAFVLTLVSGAVSAAVISTTTTDGIWSNTQGDPPANLIENVSFGRFDGDAGDGFNQVRWGVPTTTSTRGRSGLGFQGLDRNNVGLDTPFQIGLLRHYNWTIRLPGAATSSDLAIQVNLNVDGNARGPFDLGTIVLVDETRNRPPCPYNPNRIACADQISFEQTQGTDTFRIGGVEYTFDILGFGPAANQLQSVFVSQEAGISEVPLWAQIVAVEDPGPTPTPEPGALALVALGLGGLSWLLRRKSKE